ncbi:hypothetical protein LA66_13880 [Aureimonas altamirensis]|uniref:Uncharacterized protein n=1 Tax=Aureimonas altamirensis TaxID=370622 RepID=A0A0B1Q564_9HYPH|nr:hypothetical protein [Aureimonas altamirensis]KHJ54521.1 hypothetical protein LA66_13880 [Aureimonas altamirensis]
MSANDSRRGLLKLMLRNPALRKNLRSRSLIDEGLAGLCEAFDEASEALDRFVLHHDADPALIIEYRALCAEIEADVIRRCLAD